MIGEESGISDPQFALFGTGRCFAGRRVAQCFDQSRLSRTIHSQDQSQGTEFDHRCVIWVEEADATDLHPIQLRHG